MCQAHLDVATKIGARRSRSVYAASPFGALKSSPFYRSDDEAA
jgi:hypothetical protein